VTIAPKLCTREYRIVDNDAGESTRCLDLGVNRLGQLSEIIFVQGGFGMHPKDGMRRVQVVSIMVYS
jgi:hypothetical protein